MTDEEFWGVTLREFNALIQAKTHRDEREDLRAAIVASTIANVNRDPKRKADPFKPSDFMPRKRPSNTMETSRAILRKAAESGSRRA